jgi:hypothetical protein
MNLKKAAIKKEFLEEISSNEKIIEEKKFRLCRKKYFLIYSQCCVLKEELLEFVLKKFPVENYLISQEFHADGNQHLHVYLSFKKKYNVRNTRVFDYVNSSGKVFHPNIEAVKSSVATLKYLTKFDKNFVTNLEVDENGNTLSLSQQLKEIVEKEGVNKALSFYAKNYPGKVATSFNSVKSNLNAYAKYLNSKREKKSMNFYDANSFVHNSETERIINWWEKNPKTTLILVGKSGYGKTEFAKSLMKSLNPLIVNISESFKQFDKTYHKAIIYDNFNWSKCTRENKMHYLDCCNNYSYKVKNSSVFVPNNDIRKIVCTNTLDGLYSQMALEEDNAIRQRVEVVEITKSLFINLNITNNKLIEN